MKYSVNIHFVITMCLKAGKWFISVCFLLELYCPEELLKTLCLSSLLSSKIEKFSLLIADAAHVYLNLSMKPYCPELGLSSKQLNTDIWG